MEAARTSSRLQGKLLARCESAYVLQPPTDGLTAKVRRDRKFRQNLKELHNSNPTLRKSFLENLKIRKEKNQSTKTQEQKYQQRENNRQRVAKCRQLKKDKAIHLNNPKLLTRDKLKQRRETDKIRQQRHRANLNCNPQKKGWKTRRARRSNEISAPASPAPTPSPNSRSRKQNKGANATISVAKYAKRVLAKFKDQPEVLAEVLHEIVENAQDSPRKKSALERRELQHAKARKNLKFSSSVLAEVDKELAKVKHSKSTSANQQRSQLGSVLLQATQGSISAIRKKYGMNYHFWKKCKNQDFTRKKKSNALGKESQTEIVAFFKRGEISRCDPSPAAVSKKTNYPKRYMERTLKEAFKLYKEDHPGQKISFSHFAKLRPKDVRPARCNKFASCCCETCLNVTMRQTGINNFLSGKGLQHLHLPSKYDMISLTMCDKQENGQHAKDCIDRQCSDCGVAAVTRQLQPALKKYGKDVMQWRSWDLVNQETTNRQSERKMTAKRMVTTQDGSLATAIQQLENKLTPCSLHLTNADWQHKAYSGLKRNLPESWVMMCMDFAENYPCFYQDEAQGAHWTKNQVTIHPIVASYHCPEDGEIVTDSLVFLSDDTKHDAHAVRHFKKLAMDYLNTSGCRFTRIVQFSDGCAAQYKGKSSFVDLTHGESEYGAPTENHYFGSGHGKGPCDAEIGVIKQSVRLHVKSRQAQVATAEEMFVFCQGKLTRPDHQNTHSHNRRKFFFVANGSVDRERPDTAGQDVQTVVGTRKLHSGRSSQPDILSHRERSCFCPTCIAGESSCPNSAFCGDWKIAHLKTPLRRKQAATKQPKRANPKQPKPTIARQPE